MIAQRGDRAPGADRIADIQQCIDLLAAGQPLGVWHLSLGPMLLGLEQAVQLQRSLFLPVQLQQVVDQLFLLVFPQQAVRQVQVQGVASIDAGAGHP
ncbi:hypothetical protein D3C77_528810 [compost metagenome]